MRYILAVCGSLLVVGAAAAQQPAPAAADLKTIASSSDVSAIVLRLSGQPPQPLRSAPLLQLAPYTANIEYRTAVANAAIHDTEAELFYVIDGGATFVTGGQLTEAQRSNPENQTGKAITGGNPRHVAKGDFMIVPQGVPHWFSAIDGSITLMSLHLPRK
jgi:mannose-6-phosphate isomerase-like protein (cupin superfamily)